MTGVMAVQYTDECITRGHYGESIVYDDGSGPGDDMPYNKKNIAGMVKELGAAAQSHAVIGDHGRDWPLTKRNDRITRRAEYPQHAPPVVKDPS